MKSDKECRLIFIKNDDIFHPIFKKLKNDDIKITKERGFGMEEK